MKIFSGKINVGLFTAVVVVLLVVAGYFYLELKDSRGVVNNDDLKKIEAIQSYLSSVSGDFTKDLDYLAEKEGLTSSGCGPSSYAMGTILDKKFFGGKLVIDTLYDKEPEEIIERFGFVEFKKGGEDSVIDHAWIEIFIKNKIIYIDPTVYKYGKVKGIAFEVFNSL